MTVTMTNYAPPMAVFDDWCVSLDNVELLRTPVYGAALDFYVLIRKSDEALVQAVCNRISDLCEDILHDSRMGNFEDASLAALRVSLLSKSLKEKAVKAA